MEVGERLGDLLAEDLLELCFVGVRSEGSISA
jgi:hypothetical protein